MYVGMKVYLQTPKSPWGVRAVQLPKVRNHILIRKRNGESFAVNLQNGEIYSLNETAIRILELCKNEVRLDEAVQTISKEFKGDLAKVRKDVTSTIKTFRKYGFLQESQRDF